jgi:tRNA uridine 5-carbamoylmethylation protein Kti12
MISNTQESNSLKVIQFDTNNFIYILSTAIESGESILIENIAETFDSIIDILLAINGIKRGRRSFILIGDVKLNLIENSNYSFKLN